MILSVSSPSNNLDFYIWPALRNLMALERVALEAKFSRPISREGWASWWDVTRTLHWNRLRAYAQDLGTFPQCEDNVKENSTALRQFITSSDSIIATSAFGAGEIMRPKWIIIDGLLFLRNFHFCFNYFYDDCIYPFVYEEYTV